uniref:Choline/ethanolamine kinase n=1 Tax=Steinernema glaseri TaxID=37863 RepID=A0A1I7Z372_9BILA
MLFLCRLGEPHRPIRNEPDKVLLRVYFNPETESHLVAESVIFTLLSERRLGPRLYGIFNGGRLEEYIPSRPLTCQEIAKVPISNKIAKRLARVHQLDVPIWKEPDYLCEAMERWLRQLVNKDAFDLPEMYHDWAPETISWTQLLQEINYLRQDRTVIRKSTSAVAFCHNDLQEGNILLPKASSGNIRMPSVSDDAPDNMLTAFNPADPRLVLIDFEYASYNYRAFDFANHFVEYTIDYDVDYPPYYKIIPDRFPSEERQIGFFETYLREQGVLTNDDQVHAEAIKLMKETRPFIPVSHLLWGIWGVLQVEVSPVGFGFAEYGRDRLGLYFKHKHLLEVFHE